MRTPSIPLTRRALCAATLLGMDGRFGALDVGKAANMVALNADGSVARTWIDGHMVWNADSPSVPVNA